MDATLVREAAESDIPALARLHVAAWRLAYGGILPPRLLAALSEDEFERIWSGLLRDAARTTLVVCAGAAAQPAGFVAFRREPEAEIIGLYVDPAHWRTGLGTLLMSTALQRMAGAPRVVLWVMRDNARARSFYERAGFAPTGARRESARHDVRFDEVEYARAQASGA